MINCTPSSAIRSIRRLYNPLVELHVRNAIHEEPADTVGPLEDRHPDGQPDSAARHTRARPDQNPTTATFLPVRFAGGRASTQPSSKPFVDNRTFDVLDRDWRIVDAQDARAFARCRTHTTGELRKIVRLVQAVERVAAIVHGKRDHSIPESDC